jgi:putative serine protease PepD
MSAWLLSKSLGSLVAALALAGPQSAPAPAPGPVQKPADAPQGEVDLRIEKELREDGALRERIQLDERRTADLSVRFAHVAQKLRGNVIRLTIERSVGERSAGEHGLAERAPGERVGGELQIATIEVSGFVLDPAGHVVTFGNALVQAERVSVRFVNKQGLRPRRARISGTDPETDVGVLDVGPVDLPPMALGAPAGPVAAGGFSVESDAAAGRDVAARMVVSMSGVRGGENAVALGVLDGGGAPAAGGRMFQISIVRRPDTLGGIVARSDGTVVAMLYAPAFGGVPDGRMQPMLAVPTGQIQAGAARVLARAEPAERRGEAPANGATPASGRARTWIGLGASDLAEPEFLRQLDVPGAVVVDEVFEASPALAAGIAPHDVLLAWNGRVLRTVEDLGRELAASPPGSKVVLGCLRGLARRDVEVTLGAW